MSSKTTDELDDICSVCSEHTTIYATGVCDHHICFKCSTRMRVLCQQMYCAICRGELPKVVFTNKCHKFGAVNTTHYPVNRKHKLYFETSEIQEKFYKLQEHYCKLCEHKYYHSFAQYKDHMRKEHQQFPCDLCLDHLNLFSHERKFYDRKKLAEHRRVGDKDDRSHKGHPNCAFCDVRYFDKDELVRHLRKDHFFCHFCEADGIANEYYPDHNEMAKHYRNQHYLCEDGDCAREQFFTNAFRSEIDYKAHRSAEHSRNLSRSQAKAQRTIDVEVNLPPRPRPGGRGRDRGVVSREDYEEVAREERGGRGGRGRGGHDRRQHREQQELQRALTMSLNQEMSRQGHVSVLNPDLVVPANAKVRSLGSDYNANDGDFPAVDKASSAENSTNVSPPDSDTEKPSKDTRDTLAKQLARKSHMSVQDGSMAEEDFPTLGGGLKPRQTGPSNGSWGGHRSDNDYPALRASGSGTNSPSTHSPKPSRSWVGSSTQASKPVAKVYGKPSAPAIRSDSDFPSLGSIGNMLMKPKPATTSAKSHAKKEQPPPPPPQQLLSTSNSYTSSQTTTKPATGWQTISKGEPEQKQKKSKKKAKKEETAKPLQDDSDFPSLGEPAMRAQSSAQLLFGSQAKPKLNSKPSAAKGRVVDIIPAKKQEPEPAPKSFKVVEDEWKQVGNSSVKMVEVEESSKHAEKPAIDVVIKSNSKEKTKKKKEPRPSAATKNEDFPALDSQAPKGGSAKVPVGNTWVSEGVLKSIEQGDEWQEIPKTNKSSAPISNKKKGKKLTTPVVIDDSDFPSLGAPAAAMPQARWGKKGNEKQKPQPKKEEEKDTGLMKMKVKGKKKGKKSRENSPESDTEVKSNGIDHRNPEAEALIKQIAEIESKQSEANNNKTDTENGLNDFPSVHSSGAPSLLPDDFPSIGKTAPPPGFGSVTDPPPGISAPPGIKAPPPGMKAPPPGFASKKAPPPGFSTTPHDITNNSSYIASYIKPSNFQSRNQALIADIQSLLEVDTSKFDLFKSISGDFRRGTVSASTYFSRCCDIMSPDLFAYVFPELLVLLPDITKQNQLLAAQRSHPGIDSPQEFTACEICHQVIYPKDILEHGNAHADASDFPALGPTAAKGIFKMGTWKK